MKQSEVIERIKLLPGIEHLNRMQRDMLEAGTGRRSGSLMLIAPTGSGKTVAYTAAVMRRLRPAEGRVQALIIAPSRELVIQIAETVRRMAVGYKVVALYGGHNMESEANSLSVTPDIVVSTPGRLLDHMHRGRVDISGVDLLVLDEYDKSLELGFEKEMRDIVRAVRHPSWVILVSATRLEVLPDFMPAGDPITVSAEGDAAPQTRFSVIEVPSPVRDKLSTLIDLLRSLPNRRTIIFVNHRESATRVYDAVKAAGLPAILYNGALDQNSREMALELFHNGTCPVMVATDLAARGLDIADVGSIIHYHLPVNAEAWTHRNGRSGRQGGEGEVYVLTSEADSLPEFITPDRSWQPQGSSSDPITSTTATLYFNLGRKDKISRGDIVGYLIAQGGLQADGIGRITLRDHAALVAVPKDAVKDVLRSVDKKKIKGHSVRVTAVDPAKALREK